MSRARRFLVTGGAGFIGSAVVRHLIRETSHEVAVVDILTYAGNLDSLAPVGGDARYRFFRDDITDGRRMAEIIAAVEPDVILHLAAESHVDRSIDGADAFVQTNIVGTFTLLEAALAYWRGLGPERRDRFRFHHVSTDEVFGSLGVEGAFSEASPYRPNSPYAASKAAADHLVRAWHTTHGLPVVVSNCSNNFGPYQFPEKLIPLIILNCLEGKELPVYGMGENVRDWLYVDDHVRGLLLVAENGRVGETYVIGGHAGVPNLAVVKTICDLADARMPAASPRESLIRFVADRPGHDLRYSVDASKIRDELGWRPQETFGTAMEKTFDWYLANRAWWSRLRDKVYGGERLGARLVILVLGGNGQLGSELTARAGEEGAPIMAVGHDEVDIADPKTIAKAVARYRPTLIVNCAAFTDVDKAEQQVAAAQRINALGAAVAAASAKRAGLPIIHISTDYVFDGEKTGTYVEDDAIGPLSVYGRTKAGGEEGVRNGHAQHLILRTSWLYGRYGSNFLKMVLRLAADQDELGFVAAQRGSPTSTRDLAKAILVAADSIKRGKAPWGTYHVAGAGSTSRHALATFIVAEQARFTGRTPAVKVIAVPGPPSAKRPANSALDSSKFATTFGYAPGDWQESVERAVSDIFVNKAVS